jgi:uncharacterized protein with HEPN domain
MKRQTAKRLLDVRQTCLDIEPIVSELPADAFIEERIRQLAVHKLLEIVGEALNQLSREDPETSARIVDLRSYVNLRNQITHGYDSVNYSIVWDVAANRIPTLHRVVSDLLQESDSEVTDAEPER